MKKSRRICAHKVYILILIRPGKNKAENVEKMIKNNRRITPKSHAHIQILEQVGLTLCYFVLVFFSSFSIAIISLGEERDNLSAFRTFVRFALVWFCLFPLPLGVREGLRFVIVALPGLFSYRFLEKKLSRKSGKK